MARIRILELPAQKVNDFEKIPFVYVIDKIAGDEIPILQAEAVQLESLVGSSGAAGFIRTAANLDFEFDEPMAEVEYVTADNPGDALADDVLTLAKALGESADNANYGQGYRDGCRGASRDLLSLVDNYRRTLKTT